MTTACSRIVNIVLTAAGESLIAMSGGVASSVAALLTQHRGYDYVGCTMKLFDDPSTETARSRTCCALEDVEYVRSVAFRTGVPYYMFNFSDNLRTKVTEKTSKANIQKTIDFVATC